VRGEDVTSQTVGGRQLMVRESTSAAPGARA